MTIIWVHGGRKFNDGLKVLPVGKQFATGLRSDSTVALLVDVGGSHGHDLVGLKECYLDLPGRLILQDLLETLESIRSLPAKGSKQ